MRSIKKRISLWHIVLIIGIAAIAIPVATAHVSSTVPLVSERTQHVVQQAGDDNMNAYAIHSKKPKAAVGKRAGRPQDDYYEQRRQYWENRVDRRLEYRDEYLDEQTGDDNEEADAKDNKNEVDDEDYVVDDELYERRREYYRERLDEDW